MSLEVVTVGELGRRFDRFESTITTTLEGFGSKLDDRPDWADVRRIETALLVRIAALEGWQTWALRLGGPAVMGALVGVGINAAKLNGG